MRFCFLTSSQTGHVRSLYDEDINTFLELLQLLSTDEHILSGELDVDSSRGRAKRTSGRGAAGKHRQQGARRVYVAAVRRRW